MKTCFIVGAGSICDGDLRFEKAAGDLLIAADAGYIALISAGMTPDLIIGDFDSAAKPDFAGEVITLPVVKDDTDVGFAVKEGFRRGYTSFVILGGLGGKRLSHTLANIQLLSYVRSRGGRAELVCGGTRVFIIDGEFTFVQSGDPAGAPDGEFTVAEESGNIVDMVFQREEPDGVATVFH